MRVQSPLGDGFGFQSPMRPPDDCWTRPHQQFPIMPSGGGVVAPEAGELAQPQLRPDGKRMRGPEGVGQPLGDVNLGFR